MFYLAIVLCFIFKQIVKHPTVRFFNLTDGCSVPIYGCEFKSGQAILLPSDLFYYLA